MKKVAIVAIALIVGLFGYLAVRQTNLFTQFVVASRCESDKNIVRVGGYSLCAPNTWNVVSVAGNTTLDLGQGNTITIATSSLLLEDSLRKYSSDVFVDTVNREMRILDRAAIEMTGSVGSNSGAKRAATMFTIGGTTYEIILNNQRNASYDENLIEYRALVKNFDVGLTPFK